MENCSHRVYAYITEDVFYDMINEAKKENIFTDLNGRVDIGALLKELVTTFSEGRYAIVPEGGLHKEIVETKTEQPTEEIKIEKPKRVRKPKTETTTEQV